MAAPPAPQIIEINPDARGSLDGGPESERIAAAGYAVRYMGGNYRGSRLAPEAHVAFIRYLFEHRKIEPLPKPRRRRTHEPAQS